MRCWTGSQFPWNGRIGYWHKGLVPPHLVFKLLTFLECCITTCPASSAELHYWFKVFVCTCVLWWFRVLRFKIGVNIYALKIWHFETLADLRRCLFLFLGYRVFNLKVDFFNHGLEGSIFDQNFWNSKLMVLTRVNLIYFIKIEETFKNLYISDWTKNEK